MKKIYLSILASMFLALGYATTYTVNSAGSTFTPDSLYIAIGDTVEWNVVSGSHPVSEVSQANYDMNNGTSNGGFAIPSGNGEESATFLTAGTYYYVCDNHIGAGMKGKIVVAAAPVAPSLSTIWINEIHYDNAGSDVSEGVEVAGISGTDLTCYSLMLYNGSDSELYGSNDSIVLTGTIDDEGCGYGAVWFDAVLQNGAPDAFGLYNHCTNTTVQFLSYEGTITANDGPFFGMLSTDMGVSETNSDPIGTSLFLSGSGTEYSDFTWTKDIVNSNDDLNVGQDICSSVGPIIAFDTDSFEFNEADGTINLGNLFINPAIAVATNESFEVHLDAASTASTADFVINVAIPITLPFTYDFSNPFLPNFTTQALAADIVDDGDVEGDEWFRVVLRNGMNGINIGADSTIYVKIIDNDFPIDTLVKFTSLTGTVDEGAGTYDIPLTYQQSATNPMHTVELLLITGDAADVNGFTPMTATFNTISEKFTLNITDDIDVEASEVLTFALANATNGLLIGSDSVFTLTITDNDIPTYDLGLVDLNDATGADSLNLHGKFVGVVNSLDRGFNSLEFSIQDATGSVDVYSNASPFSDSSVVVGDELEIEGTIKFSNGMVRIEDLVSMTVISSGNALTPVVVTEINDMNESDLVRMNGLTLVDPAEWIASGGAGFDVHATDAAGDTVVIRIDRDYDDLYNSLAPNSAIFDIIGVASQYDENAPFDENHQIIPRDLNDVILYPTLNMDEPGTLVDEDAGTVTINFVVANDVGVDYTVDVELTGGSGTADDIDDFTTQTAVAISGGVGSITVTITDDTEVEGNESFEFTLTNPSAGLLIGNGDLFDLTINDNDADAISEINVNALTVYPNPASEKVILKMISNEKQLANITLVDVVGKTIQSNTFMLKNGSNAIELDLTKVANGNYMIHISTENGNHTENLLVR